MKLSREPCRRMCSCSILLWNGKQGSTAISTLSHAESHAAHGGRSSLLQGMLATRTSSCVDVAVSSDSRRRQRRALISGSPNEAMMITVLLFYSKWTWSSGLPLTSERLLLWSCSAAAEPPGLPLSSAQRKVGGSLGAPTHSYQGGDTRNLGLYKVITQRPSQTLVSGRQ